VTAFAARQFAFAGEQVHSGTQALSSIANQNFDGSLQGVVPANVTASPSAAVPPAQPAVALTREPAFPFKSVQKSASDPILTPAVTDETSFESNGAFNPAVILKDGVFNMLYRAQDRHATSTIGLAVSKDGVHFTKRPEPVIVPDQDYEKPGGCEDPRIVKVGDTFYVTYTGYSPAGTPSCIATSKDLIHWEKHGQILPRKSSAILNVQVNGKYWLYFGDTNIWAATSSDMIHWTQIDEPVLKPRDGSWDDSLVESGPPPIMTKQGILLIYNGNLSEGRSRDLGRQKGRDQVRQYSTGWALFDKNDPTKLIARSGSPWLTVTEPWEVYGQVGDVVFTEGMVLKGGKAYMYYGGADTTVNVAIAEPAWDAP
jgi:predicted GH43/DUF377 family glycosyl hydrolase